MLTAVVCELSLQTNVLNVLLLIRYDSVEYAFYTHLT